MLASIIRRLVAAQVGQNSAATIPQVEIIERLSGLSAAVCFCFIQLIRLSYCLDAFAVDCKMS